ncbi:MAG: hypothetical protein FJ271_21950 [Planctomycetes bacterium]|nr:hypothetical protein [Planctomycetota bacterium]
MARPNNISLSVEALERRDLMAVILDNRILTIVGSGSADTFNITRSGNSTWINNRTHVQTSAYDRIVVIGKAGNDTITLPLNLGKWSRIFGGDGNDTIRGGGGPDEIYGGRGSDTIDGRAGADVIWGGPDTDFLTTGPGDTVHEDSPSRTLVTSTAIEQEILRLVNVERSKRGLAALSLDGQLNQAARLHADAMARLNAKYGMFAAHQHNQYKSTRPTPETRMEYVGYYGAWGENIAFGYASAAAVVNAWMNSAGHRANILNSSYTLIGVAVSNAADGTKFYCQNFG